MLPQGSPCSPIIADLISHPMDVRLAQLARDHGLTYTRYADDLTFSTSQKAFPPPVAAMNGSSGSEWVLGEELSKRITRAGFAVNPAKTRMQVRTTRQLVTGLTVNAKVNIRAAYYRHARSMCHVLFRQAPTTAPMRLAMPSHLSTRSKEFSATFTTSKTRLRPETILRE